MKAERRWKTEGLLQNVHFLSQLSRGYDSIHAPAFIVYVCPDFQCLSSDHGVILNILFSRKMDDDLQTFLQQHLVSDIMLK